MGEGHGHAPGAVLYVVLLSRRESVVSSVVAPREIEESTLDALF
jgi:hypothetical protein